MKQVIHSSKAPSPIGPYSQAVRFENFLFVSGQIPIDQTTGKLVEGDIALETRQVMTNLGHILNEAGLSFEDVIKCSIFIKDMETFDRVNEVYGDYFKQNPPARETVEVSKLPKGVNVEISCMAGFSK